MFDILDWAIKGFVGLFAISCVIVMGVWILILLGGAISTVYLMFH